MNTTSSLLFLAIAIALGIALAPYVLPAIGWGAAIAVALAILVGTVAVAWYFTKAAAKGTKEMAAALPGQAKLNASLATGALRALFSPKQEGEKSTIKRRLVGAGVLFVYATWAVVIIFFAFIILVP